MFCPPRCIALLLLAVLVFSNQIAGQRPAKNDEAGAPQSVPSPQPQTVKPTQGKPATPPPSPTPRLTDTPSRNDATLETLFAADRYKLYGEVRAVGNLVRSPGVVDLLEPILKLSKPPQEFKALLKFLNANADALATSPMLFASFPAKSDLPQAIVAIELPSIEEAQKFEPKLQTLLPVIFPSPSPTPAPSVSPARSGEARDEKGDGTRGVAPAAETGKTNIDRGSTIGEQKEGPAFQIKRSGKLILITDRPFTFKSLRPVGSKLLTEDSNFRVARDRFSTEPLFLFYNVGLEDEATIRQREMAAAREGLITIEERPEEGKQETADVESAPETSETPTTTPDQSPSPEEPVIEEPEIVAARAASANAQLTVAPVPEPTPNPGDPFLSSLFGSIGWGKPAWPDAVGAGLTFENESYIVRLILIDPPDTKTTPIPFLPQIISGRAIASGAPAVLPADTEFFASASLDLPRMYAALLKNMQEMTTVQAGYYRPAPGEKPPDPADMSATEAAFEKKYGFKIKEELLPALGTEIAIGGTLQSVGLGNQFGIQPAPPPSNAPGSSGQLRGVPEVSEEQAAKNAPVFLVAVNDREAVKGLIPRLLDAMGIKALSLLAQTERRGDTEMVTYAGAFSYAFVDRFMVLSPSVVGVRKVVDSYVNHNTLSSNTNFRNLTRWQPRETQGQFYVAPSVMAGYHELARNPGVQMDAAMREFVGKLNPAPEAVSYALSNDGFGPLHELHLPKNLVLMMVAGVSATTNRTPLQTNEEMARASLYMIIRGETNYKDGKGKGSYGTLEQLAAEGLLHKEMFEKYGYKIELNIVGEGFEATATPREYGTSGRLSFFVDETGVIKGGDRGGTPASASDPAMP